MIPALTFVATANAVSHLRTTPHLVDSSCRTLGMSPESLESRLAMCVTDADGALVNPDTGRIVSAIVPMHAFGHPCAIHEIKAIGEMYNLPVVEDAAESLGSWIGNRHTGTIGELGIVSFNGNKIVTTGGGVQY